MPGYNRVILMGNLTRDPELRQIPSGSQVAEMRLAVSERYRSRQSGEMTEVTCFVDVVVWERQAELCAQYLAKGRPVLVEGRLQLDEWKNDKGETRSKLRVRGDRITFLGSGRGEGGDAVDRDDQADGSRPASGALSPPPPMAGTAPAPPRADDRTEGPEQGDADDLPF